MSRQWWTLAGTCTGLFLLMLDSTVVALALPSIRHDIGASAAGLQWVMNGYLLAIAALVVTAGRLGDMFGRKRLFLAGMCIFALGSVLSGAANDELALICGRALQGVGAAPMLPLSLAIVCNAFPAGQQARALGIWAGISAVALGIGPLAGGALVDVDWRLIFWINLPIAAIGIAITALATEESTDPGSGRRIDLPGLVALGAGLTAVVLALVQAQVWGAGPTVVLALLGLACLYAFWQIEHRVAEPIVDFSLFRNGPYFGASAAAFALVGAYWSVMFFQSQYLQDVRGHSAVLSGLMILPITVPMIFISPFSGRLITRFGARRLMTSGMILGALGLFALTQIGSGSSYALLLAGYLPFGVALGLVYAPMSTAAMAAMPAEKVGIASGVLAMDRVMAGTVALAVTGAVFHALLGDDGSFADSVAGSTWVLVALCTVGTILTWAFVRDSGRPAPKPHSHHRHFHL
ncbi:MAG TPA: MFS transporter [Solirubrobacterales bacterium]|nr:MFS transporter [Solirubrobacterales bacterium]